MELYKRVQSNRLNNPFKMDENMDNNMNKKFKSTICLSPKYAKQIVIYWLYRNME